MSSENYFEYLLETKPAEDFFNKNSPEIFGQKVSISVSEIKRSSTYNPKSCNVLYRLQVDGQERKIRLSASKIYQKKQDYAVLKYLYDHGFSEGNILVNKPIALLEEENIFLYEDIDGQTFKQQINASKVELETFVKMSAEALKKIHQLSKPPFDLWFTKSFFNLGKTNEDNLTEYYRQFAGTIMDSISQVRARLLANMKPVFCHGDFQPDNLIISADKVYIIDFTLACLSDSEYDLAHFVLQLGVMLNMYGDPKLYQDLSSTFLKTYGDYDLKKMQLYTILGAYRVIEVYRQVKEKRYLDFIYKLLEENIKVLD